MFFHWVAIASRTVVTNSLRTPVPPGGPLKESSLDSHSFPSPSFCRLSTTQLQALVNAEHVQQPIIWNALELTRIHCQLRYGSIAEIGALVCYLRVPSCANRLRKGDMVPSFFNCGEDFAKRVLGMFMLSCPGENDSIFNKENCINKDESLTLFAANSPVRS
jgi:hypothetical protein